MAKIVRVCEQCGKEFEVTTSRIKTAKFCSRDCYAKSQRKRTVCICLHCGKEFEFNDCYVKRGQGKFCSPSCATTYRNLTNNPSKNPKVRKKISENHADVSGKNNPAYINGKKCYRNTLIKVEGTPVCYCCGSTEFVDVHHIDGSHENNDPENLVFLCKKCHMGKAHKGRKLNQEFKEWILNEKNQ